MYVSVPDLMVERPAAFAMLLRLFSFGGDSGGVEIPGKAAAEAMWTECRQCAPIQLLIQSGKLFITPETKEPGDTRKSPNSLPCCQVLCVDR